MPLTEEFKIDWESRDIIGIDPDVDITTKILVKDNSPSNALINILLVGTRLNLFPVNGLIGYGEVYDKTESNVMAMDHDQENPLALSALFADGAAY